MRGRSGKVSEGALFLSAASIIAAIVCFSFGLYVFLKNPHLRSSKYFIFLASVATLTGVVDALLITAPDEGVAGTFARPTIFLSTVLAGTMLYMTSFLPYERRSSWLPRHRREYALLVTFVAVMLALFLGTVERGPYGWQVADDLPAYWWYSATYIAYLFSILILVRGYLKEDQEEVRGQIILPIFGVVLPVLLAMAALIARLAGQIFPPILAISILVSSICFGYSIIRQRLFVLRTTEESVQAYGHVPVVEAGRSVLVESSTDDLAYHIFINELSTGRPGLLITRSPPDQIRAKYGLRNTPIIWLTAKPGLDSVDPANLSILNHTTARFMEGGHGPVVLMDDMSFLGAHNKMEDVMRLAYGLRDTTIMTSSKLIIAVDPKALDKRYVSMLERELEPIRP
jgi:hypothetical protein